MERARSVWSCTGVPDAPRVLLVLDNPALSTELEGTLRTNGFEPTSAASSADALEALPGGKFAAVVAMQLLRGMDGVALCKRIKETRPTLPVLLLAVVSSPAGVNDVRKSSGAEAVFPRAFSAEAFLLELKKRTGMDTGDTRAANSPSGAARAAARAAAQEKVTQRPAAPRAGAVDERTRPQAAAPVATMTAMDPAWIFGQTIASRATGALRMAVSAVERVIHFDGGRPVIASSNVPAERIGQILVTRGVIGAAELDRFLALATKSGTRLVELLVRQGVLTATEQRAMIEQQYVSRILAAFAWRAAAIEFRPGPPPSEEFPVPLSAGKILMEGLRQHYDRPRLQALFTLDRVLQRAPNAELVLPELGLDAVETAGFLAVDGARTIGDLTSDPDTLDSRLRAFHAGVCLRLLA